MNDGKKIFTNVIKGIAGGTLIACGALSAIGFIGVASGYILSGAFVAAGALIAISADSLGVNSITACIVSVMLFLAGKYFGINILEYMASGAVMYMGCVLSMPESDVFTNAVTGGAAALGFLAAVAVIL